MRSECNWGAQRYCLCWPSPSCFSVTSAEKQQGWPSSLVTCLICRVCAASCLLVILDLTPLVPMQKTPACVQWCFQAGCAGDGSEPIFCFHSSWEPSHFPVRTQAKSSWVPISSPELSCIFPQVPERVDEFPNLLEKNQRSAWPSNEKVLVIIHSGTLKAKEAKEGYIDVWTMRLLATWQHWVSPRCSYLC